MPRSVSVEGTTAGEEGEDPLQWKGVPQEKHQPGSKVNSRGPGVVVVHSIL